MATEPERVDGDVRTALDPDMLVKRDGPGDAARVTVMAASAYSAACRLGLAYMQGTAEKLLDY